MNARKHLKAAEKCLREAEDFVRQDNDFDRSLLATQISEAHVSIAMEKRRAAKAKPAEPVDLDERYWPAEPLIDETTAQADRPAWTATDVAEWLVFQYSMLGSDEVPSWVTRLDPDHPAVHLTLHSADEVKFFAAVLDVAMSGRLHQGATHFKASSVVGGWTVDATYVGEADAQPSIMQVRAWAQKNYPAGWASLDPGEKATLVVQIRAAGKGADWAGMLADAAQAAASTRKAGAAPEMPALLPEHRLASGTKGGPGECAAECACGVGFYGFDSLAEADELLGRHIATEAAIAAGNVLDDEATAVADAVTADMHPAVDGGGFA